MSCGRPDARDGRPPPHRGPRRTNLQRTVTRDLRVLSTCLALDWGECKLTGAPGRGASGPPLQRGRSGQPRLSAPLPYALILVRLDGAPMAPSARVAGQATAGAQVSTSPSSSGVAVFSPASRTTRRTRPNSTGVAQSSPGAGSAGRGCRIGRPDAMVSILLGMYHMVRTRAGWPAHPIVSRRQVASPQPPPRGPGWRAHG